MLPENVEPVKSQRAGSAPLDRGTSAPSGTIELVEVVATGELCDYVRAHGGTLWVRSTRRLCCHGPLTLLRAFTVEPKGAERYAPVDADLPITVRFNAAHGSPQELVLSLRGLVRKSPAALWDGYPWKM